MFCLNQMYSELLQTQMSKCTLNGNNTARTDQIGAESPEQPVSTDGKNFVLFLKKKKKKSEINSFQTTDVHLSQIETEKGSLNGACFLCFSQLV